MPINGEPADVVARIESYDDWLANGASTPQLLLTFEGPPETLLPEAIAAAIVRWADRHQLRR
jgi:haloalkane dehalogenase